MTNEELREEVKEFVMDILQDSKQFDEIYDDKIKNRAIAFGAVWFVQSIEYDDELIDWWNNLIHPQFTEDGAL